MKLFELIFDDEDDEAIGLYGVSLVNNPAVGFEAIKLSEQQPFFNKEIVDALKKIGKTPLKYNQDYILMQVEDIIDDVDLTSLNFASEDTEHFEIRYRYSGPKDSKNRSFCRELLNWNKEWTIDEIELLNDLVMPGMGPRGTNSYEVLKYAGGVHCRHKFQRLIYFKKSGKKYTYEQALKMMPKSRFKGVKKLPKEVGQVASASNNFWRLKYSDETKRMLTQPILIPNQKIYRNNIKGGEAEVFASAETIQKLAKNFFKQNYQHNTTIEHVEEIEDGFLIWESWIVQDPDNDKANALGFKDLEKGTWMVTAQLSQELWDDYVKNGEVKGLSIDALLDVKEVDNNPIKFKNENKKMLKKDFLNKIKNKVKLKFSEELTIVDAELNYGFMGAEPVGSTLVDAESNPVSDFRFTYDGVDYITNAEGVIDLFVEAEAVEMNDEDMNEIVDEISEIVAEVVAEEVTDKDAIIAELEAKIAELEAQFEAKVEEVVELKKQTPSKKIGFSKEKVEAPKNETFLQKIERLSKNK